VNYDAVWALLDAPGFPLTVDLKMEQLAALAVVIDDPALV
jgi:hypothetical protein